MRSVSARFCLYAYLACLLTLAICGSSSVARAQEPLVDEGAEMSIEADAAPASTPTSASDASFGVVPVVSNEKGKARDIIKKELIVTNHSSSRIGLRAKVENVDPSGGPQEFVGPAEADLSSSLANWVEITRGVIELEAGESRKVPYLIHVNVTAKPGTYYARVAFTDGSPELEGSVRPDGTSLMLTLEVADDARERLQLGGFVAAHSLVFGADASFSYRLENVGNRDLEPRGTIRIFNRRGEEVGSVPLNADGVSLSPSSKQQLAAVWGASGRFGKYKAFLDLEYGEEQLASVQDTVYFWVFPWKEILMSLFGVFVLAIVGTYVIHLRTVARPAHVYAAYVPSEPASTSSRSVRMPSSRREPEPLMPEARVVPTTLPSMSPTVLAPRVQPAVAAGPVISLSPRGRAASPADVQSHVVQLKSRR